MFEHSVPVQLSIKETGLLNSLQQISPFLGEMQKSASPLLLQDHFGQHGSADTNHSTPLFSPPTLSLPGSRPYSDFRFIEVMKDLHETGESLLANAADSFQKGSERLKELVLENMKKLKESIDQTQTKDIWSYLKKIGSCLLSAITFVFGVSLVGSGAGTVIGAAMIASSIITIANFIMSETGTWDWLSKKLSDDENIQKKLAFWVPTAIGVIAAGIGAFGSIGSFLWSSLNYAQQTIVILQAVIGIYTGITQIGKGLMDAQLQFTQADLNEINLQKLLVRFSTDESSSWIQSITEKFKTAQEQAKSIIELAINTNAKSNQQV